MIVVIDAGKTRTTTVGVDDALNVTCVEYDKGAGLVYSDDVVVRVISGSIARCLRDAGASMSNVDLVVISWADLDTEAYWVKARSLALGIANEVGLAPSRIVFDHDAVAAYYAVTLGKPGVGVIAGTGLIAYGRNSRGEGARSSGWGWLLGDEGSAFWIALRGINAAVRAYDGRGPWTSLVDAVKRFFGVSNLLNIIDVVYPTPQIDRIAEFAKVVSEEAEKGDEAALSIMKEAGEEAALAAISVARRLGMVDEEIIVGGVGSVFNSRIVWETFKSKIKSNLRRATIKEPLTGPYSILGPLVMGLSKLGRGIGEGDASRFLNKLKAMVTSPP